MGFMSMGIELATLRPGYSAPAAKFYWLWMCVARGVILLKRSVLTSTEPCMCRRKRIAFENGKILGFSEPSQMTNTSSTHASLNHDTASTMFDSRYRSVRAGDNAFAWLSAYPHISRRKIKLETGLI
ncbi:hypothetical protein PAMA_016976 [Pampus argenteus]